MTLTPVAFPIVEMVFPAALRAALATRTEPYAQGVVVGKKVPASRPARLITFRRDGGPTRELTDYPRLGINVWAATDPDVDNLARLVVALLPTLVGPSIDYVTVRSGPFDVTDPSGQPQRYIAAEAATRAVNL